MQCLRSKSVTSFLTKNSKITLSGYNDYPDSLLSNAVSHSQHINKRTPMLTSVRHKTSLNIHRPRIPQKSKAVMLDLVFEKYKKPLEGLPPTETCINAVKASVTPDVEENMFERILSREVIAEIEAGEMLVVIHKHSCNTEDLFEMRVKLHRSNMKYLYHNNNILRMAIEGTKYANLQQLYCASCATVVVYDSDVKKLLKMERQLPYMTILGAVVEGRIMTVRDLRSVAALPDLPTMRATLLNTLSTQAQRLSQSLDYHQTQFSGSLERYSATETKEATTDGSSTDK